MSSNQTSSNKDFGALKDLGKRLLTAFAIIIFTVPIIYYGGVLNTCLLLVLYGLSIFEYVSRSVSLSKLHTYVVVGMYFLFPISFMLGGIESFFGIYICMLFIFASALIYIVEYLSHQPDIKSLYFPIVASLVYPVLPLVSLFVISEQYSGECLLWVIVSVVTADSLAYFVGKLAGGKPLSPRISPNKSWSGSIAGVIGASLASLAWGISFDFDEPVLRLIALGLLIGILAVLGDLFESLMKRAIGIKDMGSILPGHGGVLDRIDAMLFAAPVIFLL